MAPETFKKRQKEAARREKQQRKNERRLERKFEKAKGDKEPDGEELLPSQLDADHGPTIL